jgi:hypothetical protein
MQMRLVATAFTGLSAFVAIATTVQAANRFALTCIENRTNIPLSYDFRWGNDGQWASRTLQPRGQRAHVWKYEKPNETRSPWMFVRFDGDLSKRMISQSYRLQSHASPQESDCKAYGKQYVFRFDGNAKKYIDLKSVR